MMKLTWLVIAAGLAALFPGLALAQHGHGHGDGEEGALDRWLPRLEDPARASWQKPDHVAQLLGLAPGMAVADLGAGTGYFLAALAAAVGADGRVVGLDVDQELVDYMSERIRAQGWANVAARRIAVDDPGLANAPVDRVLIVNTWHHLDDRPAYAAKLAAGLRPGGAVYVVDYTVDSPHGPPVEHRLPAATVIAELAAGGFDASLVPAEELPYQYVVVARPASN